MKTQFWSRAVWVVETWTLSVGEWRFSFSTCTSYVLKQLCSTLGKEIFDLNDMKWINKTGNSWQRGVTVLLTQFDKCYRVFCAHLHQMSHDLYYLFHGRTLRGVFRPAARHQALNRLRQIFYQRRSCAWRMNRKNGTKEKMEKGQICSWNALHLFSGIISIIMENHLNSVNWMDHSITQHTFSLLSSVAHWQMKCTHLLVLTIMHSPHNAKSWSSNFIKRLPASDHFPQNDTPAEHIALLTIIATCKYKMHKNGYLKWGKTKSLFS